MDRIITSTEQHKLYRSIIAATHPDVEESPPHAVAAAGADRAEAVHSIYWGSKWPHIYKVAASADIPSSRQSGV